MRVSARAAIGVVISAALLWWALHDVSWTVVGARLGRVDPLLLALSVVASTVIFALRAIRWQVILAPLGLEVRFGPAWRATTIGMMANNVVPARAGELARAYAITREVPGLPFPAAIASLAVDRAFDAIVILALGLVALLDPNFPHAAVVGGRPITAWAGMIALLVVGLLSALYAIVAFPDALIRVYEIVTRRLSPRIEERGRQALRAFASGLTVLRHPGRFVIVLLWTTVHWLVGALGYWLAFRAVGIEVPATAALMVQTLAAFGVAVPAAPGFFGVFEAVAVVALGIYGVDQATAVTFAIVFHVGSFIPITAIGAYYASRLGLGMRELGDVRSS